MATRHQQAVTCHDAGADADNQPVAEPHREASTDADGPLVNQLADFPLLSLHMSLLR